jgi:signal transduction histidine kinase
MRWWFVTASLLAIGGAVSSAHRYRVRRAVELANLRTRIALDLHDDIGANLAKVSILSELARRRADDGGAADALTSIGRIARESSAAMSDIVWSVTPSHDRAIDLVRRMRQYGEDLLAAHGIAFQFDPPAAIDHLRLPMSVRRDLLLIFKEAVSNAARHSRCSAVHVALTLAGPSLRLECADDGQGFDPAAPHDGNGLTSIRRRAALLGGSVEVDTALGRGTRIRVAVPIAPRAEGRAT